MSTPCRVLRFRPACGAAGAGPDCRLLIGVYLDDARAPAGHIVLLAATTGTPARWAYLLSDGRATGLQSTHSRQDLEAAVREFYFQDLVADRLYSA